MLESDVYKKNVFSVVKHLSFGDPQFCQGLREKTMADKIVYIPNDDTKNSVNL